MILNIDQWLKSPPKNRVRLIGIELEGGWPKFPDHADFHGDGSVKDLKAPVPIRTGEVVSPPMEPAAMPKWVKRYYPPYVNHTCGLHIHMSFHQIRHYHRLMTQDYQDTMLEYLKRWAGGEENLPKERTCPSCLGTSPILCLVCCGAGKLPAHHIWKRLAGEEKYCHLKFWPDLQAKMTRHGDQSSPDRFFKEGSRYTAINYCFGIENRQTLEVRVLPMFPTPEQSIRALRTVLDITNACLAAMRDRTRKDRMKLKIPALAMEPIYEEEILLL